jgi:type I restriction enzyme R subunit
MPTPEQEARQQIDKQLEAAGWVIQDRDAIDLSAARGVAVREFKLEQGFGYNDYLLFVDQKAVGAFEAKKAWHTLTGVDKQVRKYLRTYPLLLEFQDFVATISRL